VTLNDDGSDEDQQQKTRKEFCFSFPKNMNFIGFALRNSRRLEVFQIASPVKLSLRLAQVTCF